MTNEQQRKMLECAAKACGVDVQWHDEYQVFYHVEKHCKNYAILDLNAEWNPLTNPLDTAEMCAELRISVLYEHDPCEFLACFAHNSHNPEIAHYKDHDNSRLKAWMYAATLVGARIGCFTE